MQARLKVLHDKANVKQVKLLPVTLIGRSTECNLKIASSQVSRNHCRITVGADAVFVEDLGSANGTLVDGQPIPPHQATAIAPGSHIIVGPAEFQIDYVASTSATVVLQRSGVPPIIELPLTEVISPPAAIAAMAAAAVAAPAVAQVAVAAVAAPVVPVVVPAPVVAAMPVAPPLEEAPSDPVLDTSRDTTLLEPGFNFGVNEVQSPPEEASEDTVFMFQETIPESVPFGTASPAEPANKKAGLKSLFSIFGRKDKAADAAPQVASAPVQPAAAPSVFLPAVAPAEPVAEVVEAVDEEAGQETIEIESNEDSQTSTDDGFGQFLSQF